MPPLSPQIAEDSSYYRRLAKRSRTFQLKVSKDPWFDMFHVHVDAYGHGNRTHLDQVRHLQALLRVLVRAHTQAKKLQVKAQVFGYVDLSESKNLAVFVHTPNPNGTDFPVPLEHHAPGVGVPHLLGSRVLGTTITAVKAKSVPNVYYLLTSASAA